MAYAKIILNNETLMDVTSDTATSGSMLSGTTATKNDGTKITGNISTKSAGDLYQSYIKVYAPAGYYSQEVSYQLTSYSHTAPTITFTSAYGSINATHNATDVMLNYGVLYGNAVTNSTYNLATQAAQTIYPSTADQTVASYQWLTGAQTIKSVTTTNLTAANIVSGVTVKVGDANNASRISQVTGTYVGTGVGRYKCYITSYDVETATAYNRIEYNSESYKSVGDTFDFSSSDSCEIIAGSIRYEAQVIIDGVVVADSGQNNSVSYIFTPTSSFDIKWYITNGIYTAEVTTYKLPSGYQAETTITPTEASQLAVSSGYYTNGSVYVGSISSTYVGTGIARKSSADTTFASATGTFTAPIGYYSAAATKTITSQAAQTIYPSTADQTVASYQWLTGAQTIKSVTTTNLTASNIVSGVVVKVGDANNASRITQITGTYEAPAPATSSLTVTPTETEQTFNATGVYGYKPVTVNAISSTYVGTGIIQRSLSNIVFESDTGIFMVPSGYYSTSASISLTRQFDQTIYTSTADQTISSYMWLTGTQTIKSVIAYNLKPEYILKNQIVRIGDAGSMSRIAEVVGTYEPEYYSIYQKMAYASAITSTLTSLSEFLNSLSIIPAGMFAYRQFANGTYTFSNVSVIYENAFAHTDRNGWTGYTNVVFNFPSCTYISGNAFRGYQYVKEINCPVCTSLSTQVFMSCGVRNVNLPQCESIGFSNFYNAYSLETISCPNCSTIGASAFYGCIKLSQVYFPSCNSIATYAFWNCKSLTSIDFPSCLYIGPTAFSSCSALTTANFSVCSLIGSSAFYQCYSLSSISFPACQSIENYAFGFCRNLISATFPSCSIISNYAFSNCSNLTIISAPICTSVGNGVFKSCSALTTVSLPSCLVVGQEAFANCYNLTSVNLLNCSSVSYNAFASCSQLISIDLPMCQTVSSSAFAYCTSLNTVSLPMCSYINTNAFRSCYHLLSLYLLGSSIPSFYGTPFTDTPISNNTTSTGGVYGSIYVPASLYDTYKTTTGWKAYSSRFVSV